MANHYSLSLFVLLISILTYRSIDLFSTREKLISFLRSSHSGTSTTCWQYKCLEFLRREYLVIIMVLLLLVLVVVFIGASIAPDGKYNNIIIAIATAIIAISNSLINLGLERVKNL